MSSQTELELIWQGYVRNARQRYDEASREFDRVATEFRESLYQSPDGGEALSLARRRQSFALAVYMRALRTFSDFVLMGVVPEDPPHSNSRPHNDSNGTTGGTNICSSSGSRLIMFASPG